MTETATFAAGCFWGVDATFRAVAGVLETAVGYTGGEAGQASYAEVCAGSTGHAEAVRVEFDPEAVSYEQLLECFWECHDPTTLNRQGPDVGTQYRSAIFFHDESQAEVAGATLEALAASGRYRRPVVTEIVPAGEWFRAEEYHQRYFEKNGGGSCGIR
ncbi:MAG: peptide-methionine (S)-S-oxide reductase [Planctomycetes bacterium]|jgi:peptide-methionine (S)-S-oxide reductase|nr:peptide-methionine (S)-S-oxide reductase [Planctomycetota bacterium]HJO25853.1 peptide-methionine (S)-S-oxide reductase MsrA [Planctomycetota bacterium]